MRQCRYIKTCFWLFLPEWWLVNGFEAKSFRETTWWAESGQWPRGYSSPKYETKPSIKAGRKPAVRGWQWSCNHHSNEMSISDVCNHQPNSKAGAYVGLIKHHGNFQTTIGHFFSLTVPFKCSIICFLSLFHVIQIGCLPSMDWWNGPSKLYIRSISKAQFQIIPPCPTQLDVSSP